MRLPILLLALSLAALAASSRAASVPEGMVLVPAGACVLGSNSGNADEKPEHRVTLRAFYIDRTEVTNAEYQRFVQATGHAAPPDWPGGKPSPKHLNEPVVNVTWYDADAYAAWSGKRLPTEAEWEKAARGADGQLLPWGNAWKDGAANLQDGNDKALKPAGSFPQGASPYGALDMIGNAWEWTDDWYGPYAGNGVPSVQYGEKYKVVKGGGAIDFYPPLFNKPMANHRASIRGRIQPFGRYDGIGFRCVRDAEGTPRVAEAVQPPYARETPVPPKIETPQQVGKRYSAGVPVRISDPLGAGPSVATFGMPFPEGVVKDVSVLRTGTPLQARPLAKWRDGSVRWALLDVPTTGKPGETVRVRWDGAGSVPAPTQGVTVRQDPSGAVIDTGRATVRVTTDENEDRHWLEIRSRTSRNWIRARLDDVDPKPVIRGDPSFLRAMPPDHLVVEDSGPMRARVRAEGWLYDTEKVVRYRCRIDAVAGSPSIRVVHSFTHLSPQKMLLIRSYALRFNCETDDVEPLQFGIGGKAVEVPGDAILRQDTVDQGSLTADGFLMRRDTAGKLGFEFATPEAGTKFTRADGWMSYGAGRRDLIAVKHFWQQFPKELGDYRSQDRHDVWRRTQELALWSGKETFEADQGLSKTHELLLSVDAAGKKRDRALAQLNAPPFGIAPEDWYCATRGLGVLAPYSLSKYPLYETEVEASVDLENRERPYGMRHFGDNYYGGPYKGINSYQDLEYDGSYNQFMQFARTGARKYLDIGRLEARHGGDIDMNHDAGPQWKHSPRHTTIEAELGHVFLRGLVASTWITGDPEGLENAKILGDWLIKVVSNPRSQGNERQIGWALYALTGIYEATWDDRYLQAMKANVDRLLAGQDNLGRFSIRWDNRISFFYGITLSGFVQYYEVTHDERIAESIRRIVTRMYGFYPEYSGRTLEGLAWLYTRTGDPEVRLTAQRTWETTEEHRQLEIGAPTIFTVRFLPSLQTLGLTCPKEWKIPETGPVEDGIHRHAYRASSGELFIQAIGPKEAVGLVLLRHVGLSPAKVRVSDLKGRAVAKAEMPASSEPLQYARLTLPSGGPYRVQLQSENTRSWDLISAEATRRVFHVPDWKNMEALTPRLYFQVPKGAREIRLALEAEGEGYKGAVAYDPQGNVAGALAKFVDFGDKNHYRYDFAVAVPAGQDGKVWSVDLQEVSVSKAQGLLPYVSTNAKAFFLPENRNHQAMR